MNQLTTVPDKQADKAQRWQKLSIEQLGYSLNLILAFTVAVVGYWFALLKDEKFMPGASAKCSFLLSLFALTVAAICGVSCVVVRVYDFRGTVRRARMNPEAPPKATLDALGRWTWRLFVGQLMGFTAAVSLLAVSLLLTFGGKLS